MVELHLFANSADPDQTLHSAVSDLGLHCLPVTHLVFNGLRCVWIFRVNIVTDRQSLSESCKQLGSTTVLSTSFGKTFFAWCFVLNENILF